MDASYYDLDSQGRRCEDFLVFPRHLVYSPHTFQASLTPYSSYRIDLAFFRQVRNRGLQCPFMAAAQ